MELVEVVRTLRMIHNLLVDILPPVEEIRSTTTSAAQQIVERSIIVDILADILLMDILADTATALHGRRCAKAPRRQVQMPQTGFQANGSKAGSIRQAVCVSNANTNLCSAH